MYLKNEFIYKKSRINMSKIKFGKYVFFLLDITGAALFGFITSFWLNAETAFIVGMLAFISTQFVRFQVSLNTLREQTSRTEAYFSAIVTNDKFNEMQLLYNIRKSYTLTDDSIIVDKNHILELWRDAISRVDSSWIAIQYARPDQTWGLGWGSSIGLNIQEERIKSGCTIKRIFVIDNEDEKHIWVETVKLQKMIGVKVGWVSKSRLMANTTLFEKFSNLKTMDIALADSRWAFLIYLDYNRNCIEACLTRKNDVIKEVNFVVNEIQQIAEVDSK